MEDKSTGLAGILSVLIPGLGQIYKEQDIKGKVILGMYLLLLLVYFSTSDSILLVFIFILYLYNIIDAVKTN